MLVASPDDATGLVQSAFEAQKLPLTGDISERLVDDATSVGAPTLQHEITTIPSLTPTQTSGTHLTLSMKLVNNLIEDLECWSLQQVLVDVGLDGTGALDCF